MSKRADLDRIYVATLMPYRKGTFEIDEGALRSHLRYFMQPKFLEIGGAVIINPEAGEVFYTTREEKRRAVQIAVEECGDKVPIFAGICAPTTAEAMEHAKDAKALGVDGLFLMPPIGAGDLTGAWDPVKYPNYFSDMANDICSLVDLPAIVHPTATIKFPWGIGFPPEAVVKICTDVPHIIGWKMTYAYEGYRLVARALRSLPRHVAILAAPGNIFHENLANNEFDGTVSGSFTYAMETMVDHINAWKTGDLKKACEIWWSGLSDLQQYVYSDYARLHIRYKTAAWLRGLVPEPFLRPPMPKPTRLEARALRDLLSKCGLNVISEGEMVSVFEKLPS